MQRFVFTIVFIVLGLGQPNAHGQQKPNPANPPTTSAPSEDEMDAETATEQKEDNKSESEKNSPPLVGKNQVNGHEVSILSASDKIAKKANFWAMLQTIFGFGTLVLAAFATRYAWGAWKTGREATKAAKEALIEAKNATSAALDANCISRDALINEKSKTRPNIVVEIISNNMTKMGVEEMEMRPGINGPEPWRPANFIVNLQYRNIGGSPAILTYMKSEINFGAEPEMFEVDSPNAPNFRNPEMWTRKFIGKGDSVPDTLSHKKNFCFYGNNKVLDEMIRGDHRDFRRNRKVFWLVVKLRYLDLSGETYTFDETLMMDFVRLKFLPAEYRPEPHGPEWD